MKKTKLLALLLAVLMTVALFAGCGNTPAASKPASTSASQPQSEPAAPTAAPPAAEPEPEAEPAEYFPLAETAELEVYMEWSFFNTISGIEKAEDNKLVPAAEEMTNVHINWVYVSSEAATVQFSTMLASGDYPDIIDNFGAKYAEGMEAGIDEDIIIDLSSYMDTALVNYSAKLDEYGFTRKAYTASGRAGGVYCISWGPYISAGWAIRQDWMDELKLDTPVTIEDWETTMEAFKTEKDCQYPMWLHHSGMGYMNHLTGMFGTSGFDSPMGTTSKFYVKPEAGVTYGPIDDTMRDYLTKMNEWYTKGYIGNDFMTFTSDVMCTNREVAANNNCGIQIMVIDQYSAYQELNGGNLMPIADPVVREDIPVNGASLGKQDVTMPKSVSTSCEDPELAARWLDFWFTDKGIELANYGVEGESFERDASGSVQFTDLMLKNPDFDFNQMLRHYCIEFFMFSCVQAQGRVITFDEETLNCIEVWGQNFDDNWAYPDEVKNNYFTTDDMSTSSAIMGDINTMANEYALKFIVGEASLETDWDAYVQQIKSMGIDDVLKMYSEKYEQYCADYGV